MKAVLRLATMSRSERTRAVAGGLALAWAAVGGVLFSPVSTAFAADASARDLEAKVKADAERANQFGKASAGTAPSPSGAGPTGTGGGSAGTQSAGPICLLGVCMQGGSQRADPVPGWVRMDKRSFALQLMHDFVDASNCTDAARHRQQLAAMLPPRNEAERQKQLTDRADLNKKLEVEVAALKGVDCVKVLQ